MPLLLLVTVGPLILILITCLSASARAAVPNASTTTLRKGTALGVLAALLIMLLFCRGMTFGYKDKLVCLGLGALCGAAAGLALAVLTKARSRAQRRGALAGWTIAILGTLGGLVLHLFTGPEIHFMAAGVILFGLWTALVGAITGIDSEADEVAAVEHIIEQHKKP